MNWFKVSPVSTAAPATDGFASLCSAALPVLAQHIESSHRQMEDAVGALSTQFSAIVHQLDKTLAVTSSITTSSGFGATLAEGRQQLAEVMEGLKRIHASRSGLADEIAALRAYVTELRTLAEDVDQVAFKTNMLALNAAIEAAHAGESGMGFAVVAHEVRELSQASRETGQRITQKIATIQDSLHGLLERSADSFNDESAAVQACETTINEMLTRFGATSAELSDSTERLRSDGESIKSGLEQSLLRMQFQDRVSQILTHATGTLRELAGDAANPDARHALDSAEFLERMIARYTTDEQRGAATAETSQQGGGITFF